MPWGRTGDTAATHPRLLAALEHEAADERTLLEVYGFVQMCAILSAGHLTDYVVNKGTAIQVAGAVRWRELVDICLFAGLMTEVTVPGPDGAPRAAFKLLDDPEFIHIRTKEEVEWERQRKSDNSNPALTVPVRMRDGDACRYCGMVVRWTARKGRLAGTYDHRVPGKPATVDTYVVACGKCNPMRLDNPDADIDVPLLPAPSKPYYSPSTISWIESNDWARRNGIKPPQAQPEKEPGTFMEGDVGGQRDPGPSNQDGVTAPRSRPAQPERRDGTTSDAGSGPRSSDSPLEVDQTISTTAPRGSRSADNPQIPADSAGRRSAGSGLIGTGRDGSGRVGQVRGATGAPPGSTSDASAGRRRRRRKSRGKS